MNKQNNERTKIYTITGMTNLQKGVDDFPDFGDTRIFGYYTSKEHAFESTKHNALDIHETIYDYVIIEEVEEGLYQPSDERWFFHYIGNDTYEEISEPDFMKHFCGISIGWDLISPNFNKDIW